MNEPLQPGSRPPADHSVELQGGYGHRPRSSRSSAERGRSAFIPMLILLVGMVGWSSFQLHHLGLESDAMSATRTNQEPQIQQAQRIRQSLESLASETKKLADSGNANAKTVVEELRKRGVTINAAAK